MTEPHPQETADPDNDGDTTSTSARWKYTNDVLGAVLVLSVPGLLGAHAAGYVALGTAPVEVRMTWLFLATVATAWAFGKGAVKLASKVRGGGK